MKKFVLVLVVLGVTAAIAYLFGTENGRARRDDLVSRVRKTAAEGEAELEIDLRETARKAEQSATEIADKVGSAIGVAD